MKPDSNALQGMTVRAFIATHMTQAIITNPDKWSFDDKRATPEKLVMLGVALADSLIAELNKP